MESKITQIEVGRLYNLGNYEHVSYKLTIEVPKECSAYQAVKNCERILEGLKPIKHFGVASQADIERKEREIKAMAEMPMVEFQRVYGYMSGTSDEIIKNSLQDLQEMRRARDRVITNARQARQAFDNLGGTDVLKDAKLEWEE